MKQKRWIPLLAILAVVTAVVASFVYARYLKQTDQVVNTFSAADPIPPEIEEEFKNNVKQNVYITVAKDTKYPVYVRATVVITWKDAAGNVYYVPPVAGTDYEIDYNVDNPGSKWVTGEGGFYYYTKPLEAGQKTDILITRCTQLQTPYEGYTLSVEIIAQTVQAVGYTDGDGSNPATEIPAYQDAWNQYFEESAQPTPEPDPAP